MANPALGTVCHEALILLQRDVPTVQLPQRDTRPEDDTTSKTEKDDAYPAKHRIARQCPNAVAISKGEKQQCHVQKKDDGDASDALAGYALVVSSAASSYTPRRMESLPPDCEPQGHYNRGISQALRH